MAGDEEKTTQEESTEDLEQDSLDAVSGGVRMPPSPVRQKELHRIRNSKNADSQEA